MKANELRLGNLFIEEHSGKIIEVIGLEKNRITFSGVFLDKWQAKPIPLTEEWLLKFGFEKKTRSFVKCIISIKCQSRFFYYIPTSLEIKHVHQLQNLFYCLCGEELKIKNK